MRTPSFEVKVSSTQLFAIAVSFGSMNSVISLPRAMSHPSIPVSLKQTFALPADLVRISVGIEDVDDLIEDLERAFAIALWQQVVQSFGRIPQDPCVPLRCRLALAAIFCLDCSVPADDQVTSLTGVDRAAAGQNGAVEFTTTHWSVVLTAQGESQAAHEALEKLCRTYWRPVYAFARRQGCDHEEAQDITQGFFALLLERRDLDTLRREKGRLRSYLLVSLKHFLADERRRAMAIKRGKGQRLIPLEELYDNGEAVFEPADPLTAERIYERRWALTLLDHVFGQLGDEYRKAGKAALFDWLKLLLPDEPGAPSQADIAVKMGMTENAVNQAFHRFRQRYQSLLREEIAHTVAMPKDVEDELRHLVSVLRA